ncbi:MAG: glycosyltransferase family 39 protein, partial [Chloroflexi bacterium]|nr:glycosyltransferase family 39 protein [Chloroflexota bacterium]
MKAARLLAEIGAVTGAVVTFLLLATYQLTLPGLYYDEAADAVPAMQIVLGQPIELARGAGIELFGRTWPLMVMDYVGAVSTYALVPFILLLGVTPEAVRAMPIGFGALTLLLSYGFLRQAFGRAVALIALWLVVVHPSFVFWTRQGVHVSSLMTVPALGASWLLLGWWRGGGSWRLVPAAFLLGLG